MKSLKIGVLWLLLLVSNLLLAQVSGTWDSYGTLTNSGYQDHGNGVIQLLSTSSGFCTASAVHETSTPYDPSLGSVFSQCFQVYFGCPGDDQIGSDTKGDGLAFSFWKCSSFNLNSGLACGGGMGYMGACADNKMITIEFDTWSSSGNNNFDNVYGNGTSTGNEDEIALHKNANASAVGYVASSNPGNLEDGLEHQVCIQYDPATDVYTVTIDGNSVFTYDATGTGNELEVYFGAGGLNQSWSSGKHGATNPVTVSTTTDISDQLGAPLCPASIVITNPTNGQGYNSCGGVSVIEADVIPPANNVISKVEFFVDNVLVGEDLSFPYSIAWNPGSNVTYAISAVATYSPSNSNSTSTTVTVNLQEGINIANTAPVIDGISDAIWNNYSAMNFTKVPVGTVSNAADLSGFFKTMYNSNGLFLYAEIMDESIQQDGGQVWENDGIEVFLDIGNNKATSYAASDFQFGFGYSNSTIVEYYHNAITGVTKSESIITGGYAMEIFIPWSAISASPVSGDALGFDVHVNDDDNGGTRDSKMAWYDEADIAWNNPSGFGTTLFSNCNPCPVGTISGDTTLCNATFSVPIQIDFTGAEGPWELTYSINGVTQPTVSDISTNPYILTSTSTGQFELISLNTNTSVACTQNISGSATIEINTLLPSVSDTTYKAPGVAAILLQETSGNFTWYDSEVGGSVIQTGLQYNSLPTQDTVVVYVANDLSLCRIQVTAIPIFEIIPEEEMYIPNLITPNQDGKNDQFEIVGLPEGSSLQVFNRWGKSIFESNDYDNKWSADKVSDGVYYFSLDLVNGKNYKGWLQVVR